MTSIKLKPEEGDLIDVPNGKTVIGRGAFLNVVDKRVSRNHGILEVEDGKLYLTPTHSNPCFLQKEGGMVPMVKDQRKLMEDEETFGLLRDRLFFRIMYDVPNGPTKSEEKKTSDETSKHNGEENSSQSKKPFKAKLEVNETQTSSDKRRVLPGWMVEMAGDSVTKKKNKSPPKRAAPVKRKAESEDEWNEEESEEEVKPKAKGRGRPVKTEKPRGEVKRARYAESSEEIDEFEESEEEVKPKRGRGKRQSSDDERVKGKKKKRGGNQSDDEQSTSQRGRPSRSAACKRGSYVDDFVAPDEVSEDEEEEEESDKNEDSDFQLDEDLEDSGSDWEMSQNKQKAKKPVRQGTRKSARHGRKKRYTSDFSDDDDEEYTPRPTKRRASLSANKKFKSYKRGEESDYSEEEEKPSKKSPKKGRGSPAKGRRRRARSESEEEESLEEASSEEEVKKKGKKKKDKKQSSSEEEVSEEEKPRKKKSKDPSESEESEDEAANRKQKKGAKDGAKKKRRPCQFGKKCYRKNPVHFKDFCHPGDESYEGSEEEN